MSHRDAPYVELEKLSPNVVGEIVDGVLYASPMPPLLHARAKSMLVSELLRPFGLGKGGHGGWVMLAAPELHMRQDVLVPDLAGWRRERMPEIPDVVGCTLAPDWVCEVLAPSTVVLDRARKMAVYAREGVKHLWLVDPSFQTLEVYRLEGARWVVVDTHVGAVKVRVEPFEDHELELGALWER